MGRYRRLWVRLVRHRNRSPAAEPLARTRDFSARFRFEQRVDPARILSIIASRQDNSTSE